MTRQLVALTGVFGLLALAAAQLQSPRPATESTIAVNSKDQPTWQTLDVGSLPPKEKEVLMADQGWATAYQNCDVKYMDRLLSDDIVFVHLHGKMDRRPAMIDEFSGCPNQFAKSEPISVRVYGNTGIVVANLRFTPKGRKEIMQILYTRVYVKQGDVWKMVSNQSTTNALQGKN